METVSRRRLRQAKVGELLSTLDAEWNSEHLQVQAQISLLRSQVAEAMDGLHARSAGNRSNPPRSPSSHGWADMQAVVQCLSAELRQQEVSSMTGWDISAPTVHAQATALYGCLLRSMGSRSLWAFARWSEAVRGLGARRFLQLTHEVLSDHRRELEDARRLGGHMRVIALIVLTRTRALHSAFLSWAHAPAAWAAEGRLHQIGSHAAVHELRHKISQLSAHLGRVGGGSEWQSLCEEVSGMCMALEHERAALASEKTAEQGARAALVAKVARLEAQGLHSSSSCSDRNEDGLLDQDEGSGAAASCVRAAQSAAAASSHAAFLAERENVMLRDELQKAHAAIHRGGHAGDAAIHRPEDGGQAAFRTPGWTPWRLAAHAMDEHGADAVQHTQRKVAVGRFALGEVPLSRCAAFHQASSSVLSSTATAFTPHVLGEGASGTARAGASDLASLSRRRPGSCTTGADVPRGPVALHARLNWNLVQAPGEGLGVASGIDPWQIYTSKHPTAFGGLGARAGGRGWL